MLRSNIHFLHNEKHEKNQKSWKNRLPLISVVLILLLGAGYLLLLVLAPKIDIASSISFNTQDDKNDLRDRIQIEKINLEVPYFDGDASALEKGAWWRFPERGSPTQGGNFILCARRFFLDLTPQGTQEKSPFYQLSEIGPGDKIRVFYSNEWYEYEIEENYKVDKMTIETEEPADEYRLILYTCSQTGEIDGQAVIQAMPLFDKSTDSTNSADTGSVLL